MKNSPPPSAADLARLRNLISSMPSLQRHVFERHRFDDVSLAEIATELRLEVRSVEELLADAMFHLDG